MDLFSRKLYYYHLPKELIAQFPNKGRSSSRLMVVNRKNQSIEHQKFFHLPEYLEKDDVLVINTSKVIPARLFACKITGARIEMLLLNPCSGQKDTWRCLIKPSNRIHDGEHLVINNSLSAVVLSREPNNLWVVNFQYDGDFIPLLYQYGQIPLPKYIKRGQHEEDKDAYQTVYADSIGSVAAPTAGLHFDVELLDRIRDKGVKIANVVLHVGLGTFRSVQTEDIREHQMHAEYCEISSESATLINQAKENGKKVVAVGTTSTRTLESFADAKQVQSGHKWSDIFLYPGKEIKIIDSLITNFHIPESTLLMLVSAFTSYELTMKAYQLAIQEKYRFFSYGDAMLIL